MPVVSGNFVLRFVAVIAFAVVAALAAFSGPGPAAAPLVPAAQTPPAVQGYNSFSHRSYSHSQLACASCHQRSDNSITPKFPGHSACTDCHLSQFVNPQAPMCALCHSSLASVPPPMKPFPTRFGESFNVKFDHAQHDKGAARPANGCVACHTGSSRRGSLSIPAGLNAHTGCYQCHTSGAQSGFGRDIAGCATCHAAAAYRRTPTNTAAFSTGFSHATHGARQRLNCADCHNLTAGRPQGQQVSAPRALLHFPPSRGASCVTCHNGKRAFGELTDCKKCHTGATFSFRGR
jgi:c(7)-type cytochrome triheme protein